MIMTKNTKTHLAIPQNLHCSTPSRICPENCRKPTQNFSKLTCQISADPKTNTMSSNTYYLTISAPSPIKSRKKIKSTFPELTPRRGHRFSANYHHQPNNDAARCPPAIQKRICKGRHEGSRPIQME